MKTTHPPRHPGWQPVYDGCYANGKGQSVVRHGPARKQKWFLLGDGAKKGPFQTATKAMRSLE